jgi:hypothetical protein
VVMTAASRCIDDVSYCSRAARLGTKLGPNDDDRPQELTRQLVSWRPWKQCLKTNISFLGKHSTSSWISFALACQGGIFGVTASCSGTKLEPKVCLSDSPEKS